MPHELKPCPFCKSEDLTVLHGDPSITILCFECGAEGPWVDPVDDSEEELEQAEAQAVHLWNHRPGEEQ